MKYNVLLLVGLTAVLGLFSCSEDSVLDQGESSVLDSELNRVLTEQSDGTGLAFFTLPASNVYHLIPQDPKNPITREKVELGKLLYHETALGKNPKISVGEETYSCASCHHATAGFQAGVIQGIGEGGVGFGWKGEARVNSPAYDIDQLDVQPLRSPSALNIAYQECVLWNGQFGATGINESTSSQWTPGTPKEVNFLGYQGTETQAIAGLTVHRMVIDTNLIFSTGYKSLFDYAFWEFPEEQRYTKITAGLAIAAYERTILANQSPFQLWLKGDVNAMTEQQKEGALLFFGKAECSGCHSGPTLANMEFHALGMRDLGGWGTYDVDAFDDAHKGRGGFTQRSDEMFKFKVPQLYNLKDSPFFGHGGSFNTVEDVIRYKNLAVVQNTNVPINQVADEFHPLNLTDEEISQLVDFVENALYDPNLQRYVPDEIPSGNCFPNNDPVSRLDLGCGI